MRRNSIFLTIGAAMAVLPGIARAQLSTETTKAVAVISPSGGNAAGRIEFTESEGTGPVKILGEVHGLEPNSVHGFHVHELGDCSNPSGGSAGSHFNPSGTPHGSPDVTPHHLGDLGNIRANARGVAIINTESRDFSLNGPNSIVGRSVIIHNLPDDLVSQPSGQSGAPIACGAIVSETP